MDGVRPTREYLHFKTAMMWAERSVCLRQQNGAVVTNGDMTEILSFGYNGPPRGLEHSRCTGEPGKCGCVHAELNALLRLRRRPENAVMFCTTAPCGTICSPAIINAGIRRVFYSQPYRNVEGLTLLSDAGVAVLAWDLTNLKPGWGNFEQISPPTV